MVRENTTSQNSINKNDNTMNTSINNNQNPQQNVKKNNLIQIKLQNQYDTHQRSQHSDSFGDKTNSTQLSNNMYLDSICGTTQDVESQQQTQKAQQKNQFLAFTVILVCAIYIIQDIFTREKFSKAGSYFIESVQDWPSNDSFLYGLSQVVSDSSFAVTGIIMVSVVWRGPNRIHTFNYLIVFAFTAGFLSTLKLIYNDPRPYMEFNNVIGKECSAEYGNPSGHAMLNLFAAIYGISVLGRQFYRKFWYICVILGFYLMWVGFTRIHLGVHGVNQVLLGWIYALGIFFLFRFILFEKVNKSLMYLAQIPRNKVNKASFLLILSYITHSLILTGIFIGVKRTYEEQNDLWDSSIEIVCKTQSVFKIRNKYLYNKCFIDAGIGGASFGLLLGIIFAQGSIENCHNYGKYLSQLSLLTQLKRMTLIAIIPGSIFGISALSFHFLNPTITYWRFYFYLNFVPFVCAFLVIYLSPKLLNRYSLEIEGDFLKLEQNTSPSSSTKSISPTIQKQSLNLSNYSNFSL